MNLELFCLIWAVILGLVHILLAGHIRTKELGVAWNMGARDGQTPQPGVLAGRLARAQANFFETFPLFAVAVLITAVTQSFSAYSHWGALIYLVARVVYLPLYAFGIPKIRSLVWLVSMLGFLLVFMPLLF